MSHATRVVHRRRYLVILFLSHVEKGEKARLTLGTRKNRRVICLLLVRHAGKASTHLG